MNFGDWLRRFFAGRYGMDTLNKVLFAIALVLLVISWFLPHRGWDMLLLIVLVIVYFRFFSRNIASRYRENQRFLQLLTKPRAFFRKQKYHFDQRKTYRFFRCPKCHKELRVPVGKGKICVICPRCGEEFIKKS